MRNFAQVINGMVTQVIDVTQREILDLRVLLRSQTPILLVNIDGLGSPPEVGWHYDSGSKIFTP